MDIRRTTITAAVVGIALLVVRHFARFIILQTTDYESTYVLDAHALWWIALAVGHGAGIVWALKVRQSRVGWMLVGNGVFVAATTLFSRGVRYDDGPNALLSTLLIAGLATFTASIVTHLVGRRLAPAD